MMLALSAVFAVLLALAHLGATYLRFIHFTPRSRWLSFGSGVSVAFIFLELLPAVHRAHADLEETAGEDVDPYLVYALTLVGLVIFYGLEVAVRAARRRSAKSHGSASASRDGPGAGLFLVHVGAFAFYNAIIGSLLVDRMDQPVGRQLLFFAALAVHMATNDFALREHHEEEYRRYGRWFLAGAVILGWSAALFVEIPQVILAASIALLAGAIMLNVLKEELPSDRESRFGAFLAGCVGFAALLLSAGR